MPGTDPTHIAGYRIVRTIGRGGMSTVYLAQHLHLNRQVALKVLDPELADAGTFRERFARESQIVAELEHPHIVPVYDAGEADGLLYMVMRYVENRDLRSLLPPGATLPHERVRTLVQQVAGALEVAHDAGLVHRDIKPANVLASTDRLGRDHFYLSDFGITKRTDGPPLTATGQVLGSADFIAPEQISGRPLDRRTDVYALGVLVYRCLTGHLPFERDHEVAVLLAHAREVPQPASSVRPELTPVIDAVLARVLSKDPGDR
ncbi:serine/threonine protein kinase, partial [Pseudonocardia sp. KRD-184]